MRNGLTQSDHRLLSRPLGVEWAGWQTDTFRLQQSGWEIATEYDMRMMSYRLLLRHQHMKLMAITRMTDVDHLVTDPTCDLSRLPVFHVTAVAPSINVVEMHDNFSNFQQIDAQPQFTDKKITSVDDMNIFATCLTRTDEIMIDKADMNVIDHLEAIKELQSPKQREIRDRIRREGAAVEGMQMYPGPAPRQEVVAQLIHVA